MAARSGATPIATAQAPSPPTQQPLEREKHPKRTIYQVQGCIIIINYVMMMVLYYYVKG